jgi:uncharacterized Rossmann fold enzyme
MLAAYLGAEKIILVGYDCSVKKGYHWHGEHPKPLTNCKSIKFWPGIFEKVATNLKHIEVINASRETALTCFKKESLEAALNGNSDTNPG